MQLSLVPNNKIDPKVAEILVRLRDTFAEKGFDGASMQDLARAAGISVGNFYRYFPSKSDIITQMIALDMADMQGQFAAVLAAPAPMMGLRALIAAKVTSTQLRGEGQLWAEIAAMSRRNIGVGHIACAMEDAVTDNLIAIFAAETGMTRPAAKARFAAEAAFIMVLVRAAATASPRDDTSHDDLTTLILRTINQTLDTIAGAADGPTGLKGL